MERKYDLELPLLKVKPKDLIQIEDTIRRCYDNNPIEERITISWKDKKDTNARTYTTISELDNDTTKPHKVYELTLDVKNQQYTNNMRFHASYYNTTLEISGEETWAVLAKDRMKELLKKYEINYFYRGILKFKDVWYLIFVFDLVILLSAAGSHYYINLKEWLFLILLTGACVSLALNKRVSVFILDNPEKDKLRDDFWLNVASSFIGGLILYIILYLI
jgi:hypothetical protein